MDQRKCLIVFVAALVLIIVSAVIGGALEANGVLTAEDIGPSGLAALLVVYAVLACVMSFALVPLAIKFFINGHIRIGNSELFLVKWLQKNEKKVVCGVWAFFATGLCIALPVAVKAVLSQ